MNPTCFYDWSPTCELFPKNPDRSHLVLNGSEFVPIDTASYVKRSHAG